MCGIIGVYGRADAAEVAHWGLYALQHRGQESAGIVAVDESGYARAIRALGLVSDGIDHQQLSSLQGSLAIGHTRYSTAGATTIENVQPLLVRFRGGYISLGHNGNIVNASELRQELEQRGSIFTSTMDTEVLVHRMAMSTAERPEEQLADAVRGVEGAYCLVVTVGTTLLAARDPHGWRPLAMGRFPSTNGHGPEGGGVVFASESCALDMVGAVYEREVEPGEIIAVDPTGVRSSFPLAKAPLHRCVFEHVYFSRPDSLVFGASVESARRELGRRLARECPAPGAELVFSVPY
jgi:amidophosphoribosyltransferase